MAEAKKTALYDVHLKLGAKMVEFGGFIMPLQYTSIMAEHRRVRTTVGMFDVSHMGEFTFYGENALPLLQKLTINDVSRLIIGQVQYSAMCYEDGGLVDDLLVYRFSDHYMMVVNAANTEKDWNWILNHRIPGVEINNESDNITLIAVQGRKAEATLQKLTALDLSKIARYHFQSGKLAEVPMTISRTGYTGEDGFELYFDKNSSHHVWNAVMEAGQKFDIEPIGLGARDTLRLEMKYCLYGNDIDQTTNPLEAGLGWITKFQKGEFIGREALFEVKQKGVARKLIGFVMQKGRAFPRHGYRIFKNGEQVGQVTSGTFSPIFNIGIGMGYVKTEFADVGTELLVEIRNNMEPAKVVRTPFYEPIK